jgi:type IV secretion system protein VirD4
MTPSTSSASWVKPAIFSAFGLAGIGLAMQVAGLVFAGLTGAMKPADVTPWTIYQYWYWYGNNPTWKNYLLGASIVGALALLVPLAVGLVPRKKLKLHGEAKWATKTQMRAAGLFGQAGIIVGKIGRQWLIFNGTEQGKNVLASCAPGSGKTQGLMIPNALNWPGSFVGLDIKGDCFERTAGYRTSMGQQVYQLNLLSRDYRSHQYNPFAYVPEDRNFRQGEIDKIGNYLVPDPLPPADPFWAQGARAMFSSLAWYLYDIGQVPTLGTILDLVDIPVGLQAFAKKALEAHQAKSIALSSPSVTGLSKIANRAEKTHSGMVDQLTGALAALRNPIVRFATNGNSVDLRKLREQSISIYLTVLRPDLPLLAPVINVFFQQLVDLSMTVEFGHDPAHRHEVLLGMDEFAQLGKLNAIAQGITLFRSYGLRLLTLVQAASQFVDIYGAQGAETFEGCFDCSVFFTPAARDLKTAKYLSDLLGADTVKGRSESKRKTFDSSHDSSTTSDQRRPLMLPQEVLRMSLKKAVVLISGAPPIFADKIKAWKEPMLIGRVGAAPETPKMVAPAAAPPAPAMPPLPEVIVEREVEVADIASLDALTLADFSCDFSAIEVPEGELTDDQVAELRDRFLDVIALEA